MMPTYTRNEAHTNAAEVMHHEQLLQVCDVQGNISNTQMPDV
jgi:hypothetical protein